MSEREWMLVRVGRVLAQVARPHPCDGAIPAAVQSNLWELGVPCDEETPREVLIAQLWARKRKLRVPLEPLWGGAGPTPPAAA